MTEESDGLIGRWLKFNGAGLLGVVVQLAVLAFLTRVAEWRYLAATVAAVESAVLHNFVWHERVTWRSRTEDGRRFGRLARFNLSNGLISVIGNLVIMRVLAGSFGVPVLIANLFSIGFCSTLNFVVSEKLVFVARRKRCATYKETLFI